MAITWDNAVKLATLAFSIISAIAIYSWRGGAWTGNERRRVDKLRDELDEHKRDVDRRFLQAGKQTSDAWSFVQGLEGKIQRDFASRDLTDERFMENRREHQRFQDDIKHLHDSNGKRSG